MLTDPLALNLFREIRHVPLIDPHTHINPHSPAARNLDEILGYHYYTELAHSAGLDKAALAAEPRERVRTLFAQFPHIDNTVQYSWFVEIARTFLGFQGEQLQLSDCDFLLDAADRLMAQPDWEEQVLQRSNLEKVFLTNDFDDPLEGFDTERYVPCLRTDDLVFHLNKPEVRQRLARATRVEVGDPANLRWALAVLFEHFSRHGAKACAISLPPDFTPVPVSDSELARALTSEGFADETLGPIRACGVFWALAEHCRQFGLPFDLMIGVNRRVYRNGVYQGQDLFDRRTSLIQFAELFNAFPEVTFPISVLASGQNQELASYAWIFPNVVTFGHWWYSNVPVHIANDLRARLQAVPKTKQLGYYSDAYKLEFSLPKYNTYRRVLAQILADDFVRPGIVTEVGAISLAKCLLRDNVQQIFRV